MPNQTNCSLSIVFHISWKSTYNLLANPAMGQIIRKSWPKEMSSVVRSTMYCYFKCCDPVVKTKLFHSYCSNFYGSVLWDMSSAQLRVFALHGKRAWGMYGTYQLRLTPGLLHQSASCYQLEMNLSSSVCLLLSSVCPVITVFFVLYLNTRFYFGTHCLPLVLMSFSVAIIWTCSWVIFAELTLCMTCLSPKSLNTGV